MARHGAGPAVSRSLARKDNPVYSPGAGSGFIYKKEPVLIWCRRVLLPSVRVARLD